MFTCCFHSCDQVGLWGDVFVVSRRSAASPADSSITASHMVVCQMFFSLPASHTGMPPSFLIHATYSRIYSIQDRNLFCPCTDSTVPVFSLAGFEPRPFCTIGTGHTDKYGQGVGLQGQPPWEWEGSGRGWFDSVTDLPDPTSSSGQKDGVWGLEGPQSPTPARGWSRATPRKPQMDCLGTAEKYFPPALCAKRETNWPFL